MAKVIDVFLIKERKHYYFSSITAVYSVFTADDIGVTKTYLLHAHLPNGGAICNGRAIIKQGRLITGKAKKRE
jgi:hypothetical protein